MSGTADNRGVSGTSGEAVVGPQNDANDFENAFDEAGGIGVKADQSAATGSNGSAVDSGLSGGGNSTDQAGNQQAGSQDGAAGTAGDVAAPDQVADQRWMTLKGIHKRDKEAWETEKADLLAKIEASKKPAGDNEQSKREKEEAQAFIDSLTEDEKRQLEMYDQDFDTVSKMEGLKRKVEFSKISKQLEDFKKEVFDRITAQGNAIEPVIQKTAESDKREHFDAIKENHSDYETYRDNGSILKWIESKPKYIQPALMDTYSKGTAEDVIDLIADFKIENNIPVSSGNVVNLDRQKTLRKQALMSVTGRRGAVNLNVADPGDYDSAFDEALNK